ncbi:MAG: hypothetical protein QXT58_05430 [Archaeoglobaceae archaeon]
MLRIPKNASRGLGWRTWNESEDEIIHAKLVEDGWEITVRRKDPDGRWWESSYTVDFDDVVDEDEDQ